jgi:hypothetical protein
MVHHDNRNCGSNEFNICIITTIRSYGNNTKEPKRTTRRAYDFNNITILVGLRYWTNRICPVQRILWTKMGINYRIRLVCYLHHMLRFRSKYRRASRFSLPCWSRCFRAYVCGTYHLLHVSHLEQSEAQADINRPEEPSPTSGPTP